jgi:hypothetical protein
MAVFLKCTATTKLATRSRTAAGAQQGGPSENVTDAEFEEVK